MINKEICPVDITMRVISGKWKTWVIWQLSKGLKKHSELKKNIPNISGRILTIQLKELEKYKIIERSEIKNKPIQVEYYLTNLGKSLIKIFDEMEVWGINYAKINNFSIEDYKKIRKSF